MNKTFLKAVNAPQKIVVFFALIGICVMLTSQCVNASEAWIDTSKSVPATATGLTQTQLTEERNPEEDSKTNKEFVGWISRALGWVTAGFGTSLEMSFASTNISIDSVIFGQYGGAPLEIGDVKAPFTFELIEGNPYGSIGAFGYSLLRQVVYVFAILVLMTALVKYALNTTGQNAANIKESFVNFTFVLILLQLMPQLVNYVVYLRKLLTARVQGAFSSVLTGNVFNITDTFYNVYEQRPSFPNGFLYLASVGFILYLMGLYIGNALYCTILFVMFPIVALFTLKNKGLLVAWLKMMLGTLLIPLFDALLLAVPAAFAQMTSNTFFLDGSHSWIGGLYSIYYHEWVQSIFVFIICLFIVPARKMILAMLGLNGAGEGEVAGTRFFGMGMAGISLATGAIKAIATEGSSLAADAAALREQKGKENLSDDLANADKAKGEKSNKRASDLKTNTALEQFDTKDRPADEPGANSKPSDSGNFGSPDNASEDKSLDNGQPQTESAIAAPATSGGERINDENELLTDPSPMDTTATDTENPVGFEPNDQPQEIENSSIVNSSIVNGDERLQNLQELDNADKDIQKYEEAISSIEHGDRNPDGSYSDTYSVKRPDGTTEERLSDDALKLNLADIKEKMADNSTAYANGEISKQEYDRNQNLFKAENDRIDAAMKRNAVTANGFKGDITTLRNVRENAVERERSYAAADKALGGTGKAYSSPADMKRSQEIDKIYAAHANHRNFDSAQFATHLSSADKARFQRERTIAMRRELAGRVVKDVAIGTGIAVGGGLGFATTAMTDNPMGGAMAGASAASGIASAVEISVGAVKQATPPLTEARAKITDLDATRKMDSAERKFAKADSLERSSNVDVSARVKELRAGAVKKEKKSADLSRRADELRDQAERMRDENLLGVTSKTAANRDSVKPLNMGQITPKKIDYDAQKIRELVSSEQRRVSQQANEQKKQETSIAKNAEDIYRRSKQDDDDWTE